MTPNYSQNMTKKYRPYFTLEELSIISSSLKSSTTPKLSLISYIDKYISDITHGLRESNHTLKPTIEQRLGLVELNSSSKNNLNNNLGYDKEELFKLYMILGSTYQTFNPAQILLIQEYKYKNDLMGETEEIQYEKENGLSFG